MSEQEPRTTPPAVPAPAGAPAPADPAVSDAPALGRLLQDLASELNLLGHGFAAASGLHATDVQALLAVMRATRDPDGGQGGITPGRLREELALTSGAVTAVLDRLERAGHIRRTRDAADRRQVHVHHLPGAGRMAAEWFAPVARRTETVRGEFTPAELAAVARFLGRMTDELESLRHTR
ncbi:MarR family winged helix-turn-helix transcriptional regulator [Kitasatospora sp. A2-31]|uniref:MarR family winged helix-turn-helix transcriptional regulator n=1 Tax=Kitasatospora sp. A2-31 TaxID=2916414 RepID=UPI001EEB6A37|nr:MarR family winged helix-turn-helix transcriptional regulator [Kitasatospora sp. A2-31]MCG6497835.1 MarR family winged helix-turn-helix transcriptional regulator [Kitasatospora sp. A2-31]